MYFVIDLDNPHLVVLLSILFILPLVGCVSDRCIHWPSSSQVGALEIKFWEAFCKALDIPDLVDKQMAHGEEGIAARARLQVRDNLFLFDTFTI
jgi:hypothetical protein